MTISARPIVPLSRLTYKDVEQKYGPQTKYVEALLARAATLTVVERAQVYDVQDYVTYNSRYAAYNAVEDITRNAVRYETWNAAREDARYLMRNTVRYETWYETEDSIWYLARDAAVALIVRDLITSDGFTQEHYDTLTLPWRLVVGPIHPDDTE